MSTPHKHAAAIHAWADGAVIEDYSGKYWAVNPNPSWSLDYDFCIKPHRWQAEIDAQKAGKAIQARVIGSKFWTVQSSWDFEIPNAEFRIKPEMLRYRVGLFINLDDAPYTGTVDSEEEATDEEKNKDCFVRWLGDWQEVEA